MMKALEYRAGQKEASKDKPFWQRLLESTGGTALITVVIGGFVGQLITCSVQNSLKEREFQQSWMKARGDQALVAYGEFLNKQQESVKSAYELIGSCITASESLIALTGPEFAPGSHVGVEEQRTSIRSKYNLVNAQWRTEREKLGLLMSYYHHGQVELAIAWANTQASVTSLLDCSRKWYLDNEGKKPVAPGSACVKEREELRKNLGDLTVKLEAARKYAWEGWESPDKLKTALEKKP
ncbi:MAG: hypothetical protein AB1631_19855 [Acidobacteriota bacterium]